MGWDLSRAMKHFDAVGGYTNSAWTSDPNSAPDAAKKNGEAIEMIRRFVPGKPLIFTFWTANKSEERLPGPAVHPIAHEIIAVCQEALRLGVTHIDMYGYRIGEFKVPREQIAA